MQVCPTELFLGTGGARCEVMLPSAVSPVKLGSVWSGVVDAMLEADGADAGAAAAADSESREQSGSAALRGALRGALLRCTRCAVAVGAACVAVTEEDAPAPRLLQVALFKHAIALSSRSGALLFERYTLAHWLASEIVARAQSEASFRVLLLPAADSPAGALPVRCAMREWLLTAMHAAGELDLLADTETLRLTVMGWEGVVQWQPGGSAAAPPQRWQAAVKVQYRLYDASQRDRSVGPLASCIATAALSLTITHA